MSNYVIDIEADGPIPGEYSMVELGAVKLTEDLNETFYAQLRPISDKYIKSALGITPYSREQTMKFKTPLVAMTELKKWIEDTNKKDTYPLFFSDNNGFDFMFTHWYFIKFLGTDPFGHSSRNIQDIFKGMKHNMKNRGFKKLRKGHSHNPVDDARANAVVLLKMVKERNLKGIEIE